jgi:hypothetical protein
VRWGLVTFVSAVAASRADAQSPMSDRWAVQVGGDAGTVPSAGRGCYADTTVPVVGGGFGILHRFGERFVAIADTRWSGTFDIGCKLTIPAPRIIGPNQFETGTPRLDYPWGKPRTGYPRTGLRVGIEPSIPWLRARATAGGGFFWGMRSPFATAALEASTPGRRLRVVFGVETSRAWMRVNREYTRWEASEGGTTTVLPSRFDSRVDGSGWTTVRLGLEMPLNP